MKCRGTGGLIRDDMEFFVLFIENSYTSGTKSLVLAVSERE